MSRNTFTFERGNLGKLLAVPLYLLGAICSWFIPRNVHSWAFGSGIGVGEGARELALEVQSAVADAKITWLCGDEVEAELARELGFDPVQRTSIKGFWATLRAAQLVVTHGLGDVNRFAIFGAMIIHLWHGAPLKRIHLDSRVTTSVHGSGIVRRILTRLYRFGAGQVTLYVAGSQVAADRLRSAFRVQPGIVRVLGDARLDPLRRSLDDPEVAQAVRESVATLLDLQDLDDGERFVLYAPTWRDGARDPAVPTAEEAAQLHRVAEQHNLHFVLRPHPLGSGQYEQATGERVHLLTSESLADLSPVLSAFSVVITDYSSVATDFALTGRPIVWFAPDLSDYAQSRGLYEPLAVTSRSEIHATWDSTLEALDALFRDETSADVVARHRTRELAQRFHAHPEGGAARRVLDHILTLHELRQTQATGPSVFFESFYGSSATCNPRAIHDELARIRPDLTRYWSVAHESVHVPDGTVPVLVGGPEWHFARKQASLLVVNDWLRFGFRRRRGQTVLQTWHGTPLKHIALGRPQRSLRTRLAIRRESRRWTYLLSQNPHSTNALVDSYAFSGEVLELGYPRTDALARTVSNGERLSLPQVNARRRLAIDQTKKVLLYAPTWRDRRHGVIDDLDVEGLAEMLGEEWLILARGHSRTLGTGSYALANPLVRDMTEHPDVNDVLIAADVLVTDYSSIMFDASVAHIPTIFFVPDLATYRDEERGFTFDFERRASGPLVSATGEVAKLAQQFGRFGLDAEWMTAYREHARTWREEFNPFDDGQAATRVVEALIARGVLSDLGIDSGTIAGN